MKVLYIAPYRDGTGWANSSIANILALDTVGVEVVPRPVKLNQNKPPIPERILELEGNSISGCTHVIQQVLPPMMEYRSGLKNIAYFLCETDGFRRLGWEKNLNLMDEVWTSCSYVHDVCIDNGVTTPLEIIPYSVDPAKYKKEYPLFDQVQQFAQDKFVFYTISEFSQRKGLSLLLQAFHLEFNQNEPVELLLKLSIPGNPNPMQVIDAWRDGIKRGMKLYKDTAHYKKEAVLCGSLSEDELNSLHQHLDCFVSASYGEGFCLPAMDAVGFRSTPIVPSSTGFKDFIDMLNGWKVPCTLKPCFGALDSGVEGLYSSEENWYEIDVNYLRGIMRKAYEDKDTKKTKEENSKHTVQAFSHKEVGKLMKELLSG